MKLYIGLIGIIATAAFLAWTPNVEASSNCGHGTGGTGNWCEGWASTGTGANGLGSLRCFDLRATNSAPTCPSGTTSPTAPETNWMLDAGSCQTFYWFTTTNGATPPVVPNKVTLQARYDNSGTVIITWQLNGALPANGSPFTLCGTNDGLITGSPRAGTMRLYINAIKDNAAGGVGNYNVNSDGGGSPPHFDKGIVLSRMIVSDLTRNPYPAGSQYAYGTAADELITITATFTEPFADAGIEVMRTMVADAATFSTVFEVGAAVDVDSGSLVQSFVVDNTFTAAGNSYTLGLQIRANSLATGQLWTNFALAGNAPHLVITPGTTATTNLFIIQSDIDFDADGLGTPDDLWTVKINNCAGGIATLYNKGETICAAGYLLNSRGEVLTRAMTLTSQDFTPTLCNTAGSVTPVAGLYTWTLTIPTSAVCLTANDMIGSPRVLKAANTDQSKLSNITFRVSSLIPTTAWLNLGGIRDTPQDLEYFIRSDGSGGDASDTIHLFCHVEGVRLDTNIDTSGGSVVREIKDPTTTIRATDTTDTGSDGWTPVSLNLLATTPLGTTWDSSCASNFNGNTGTDTQLFSVDTEGGNGTTITVEEVLHVGDPLKLFCNYFGLNDSILCTISESYLDGTARTGNALGTDVFLYAPDGSLVVNGDQPTEVGFGTYKYWYTNSTEGNWLALVRTMNETGANIGTSNLFTIDKTFSEHRERSFEFQMDVFLLLLAIAFFVVMAEMRNDALYWFFTTILSLWLLFNRPSDSIIPIPLYIGWIFITLYQAVSLLMTKKAQNLSNTEE